MEEDRSVFNILTGKPSGDHLEGIGVNGKTILEFI
jgi:hypothetical protein